jgi:hypothetical protein
VAQRAKVPLDRRALLPAAPLEVVVDDVLLIGFEVAGQEILERKGNNLVDGSVACGLDDLVRRQLQGVRDGAEMVLDHRLTAVAPFLPVGPHHDREDRLVRPDRTHQHRRAFDRPAND